MTLACWFFSHLDPVNASQIPTQLTTRSAVIAGILEATSLGCHGKLVEQIQNTKPPKWEEFLHRTVRWGSRRYVPGLCYKNPKTQTLGYVLGGYLEKIWKNPRIKNTKLQRYGYRGFCICWTSESFGKRIGQRTIQAFIRFSCQIGSWLCHLFLVAYRPK